jgi:carbon monoxide dehydrogenase subunit G
MRSLVDMSRPSQRRALLACTAFATFAALTAASLPTAQAHGPSRLKVSETITIDAPAAAVWAKVGNFDALKDWHPAVAESSASNGNAEGSVRVVKLKGGGEITETLNRHEPAAMRYIYRVRDGGDALPVTNYSSTLELKADGDKTIVEWRGAFYRGFPNNDPPPEKNDDAAIKAVTAVYTSGLAHLKTLMEKR